MKQSKEEPERRDKSVQDIYVLLKKKKKYENTELCDRFFSSCAAMKRFSFASNNCCCVFNLKTEWCSYNYLNNHGGGGQRGGCASVMIKWTTVEGRGKRWRRKRKTSQVTFCSFERQQQKPTNVLNIFSLLFPHVGLFNMETNCRCELSVNGCRPNILSRGELSGVTLSLTQNRFQQ